MSDEYEQSSETHYSAFWPLCILLIGLLVWSGYQVWSTNKQRSVNEQQFQAAYPTIKEAQDVSTRYVALMKDLVETAQKDPAAADIVKAAIAANLIHVQPKDTNSASATPPASK
jgi:cytoskeletal protein RodZ